jgi:hypothetical protein
MTNTNDTMRANKLSVRPEGEGFIAEFYRTHAKVASINSTDTIWLPLPDSNKSAQREEFRSWIGNKAHTFGVTYDPSDRRTDENKRMATYPTDADLSLDVVLMIQEDVQAFVAKMPDSAIVTEIDISVDDIRAMTKTTKGTDLSTMGIYDGRYLKNGNWAWADIDVVVTLKVGDTEIYQPIAMQLVSGQLKKMHMTQTAWNTDTHRSMLEAGLVVDVAKAEKSAKVEVEPTTEEIELEQKYGLVPEIPTNAPVQEPAPIKAPRKPRTPKNTSEVVEG